ncbi:iron-siderophore ABC transporter substrate-binding protein [Amycolatopsis sp. WAC 01416]|uniref:iron-siderophore ABC transporter substrate-binding protein n=1 Tax=Amycolatopsis sp. WAC 01416 TaxID=2203196 RepID=UPI0018F2FF93|nr:iron-siderophore ABC transporter substrate-binding protein [Amycolatopsis sp. WAC 01416]
MSVTGVRVKATLTALMMSLLVAGCGSSQSVDESLVPPEARGTFPVTVEHKYGSASVEKQPSRIVTLGLSDHDAVLALGIRPVGAVDWFKERPYGKWPWTQARWGDKWPEVVGERDDFNFEKIAALKPDLILAQYSGMKKEQYDKLSQLAPVVAQPSKYEDYAAPWQEMTRMVGRALGLPQKADDLIAGIDRRFAQARAEHPGFAKLSMVVADTFEAGKFSAFTTTDPKMIFMTELGFRPFDPVKALSEPENNVVEVSSERFDLFDADRLVWLNSDVNAETRVRADPVYRKLKVSADKRDLFITYENPPVGAAISFNTVLSIPYAIEQLVPKLAAVPGS